MIYAIQNLKGNKKTVYHYTYCSKGSIPPAVVQSAHHQGTGCLVLTTAYKLTSVGLVNTMPLDDVALNRWSHPDFSDGTELSYRQGIHGILTLETQITKLETKLIRELEDLDKARLSYTNALKQHRDATAIIALAKDVRKHERVVQRNNVHKAELETQITNVKTRPTGEITFRASFADMGI